MTDELDIRTIRGRAAKQERSERTRRAIVQAVLEIMAEQGVAGLTHRLVAERSGASLAATTYYFASKTDMIAEASNELLRDYLGAFEQIVDSAAGGGAHAFRRFVAELAAQAMGEYRAPTLAWSEIILEGARHPEGRALARIWFGRMIVVWRRAAKVFGLAEPEAAARSGMDLVMGALFHGLALGFGPDGLAATLTGPVEASALLPRATSGLQPAAADARAGAKAAATRERILEAAILLLANRGVGAVNYRSVALEAGLTAGAPAYHFASAEALLAEAQALLFERSRARYGESMSGGFETLDRPTLVELAAVVFQSEATVYGPLNLATFAIWLQAAREPAMRARVQDAIGDLHRAWRRMLAGLGDPPAQPLHVQYFFIGALIRVIACGVTARDLVDVRAQLKEEISALTEGRHWLQAGG